MTGGSVSTRLAEPRDIDAMARLLDITRRHYWGDQEGTEAACRRVAARLVGDQHGSWALLGWVDGEAVGFATFSILLPGPGEEGVLFMKDLFVIEEVRGRGVGQAIVRRAAALAVEHGCERLDWTTERDNTGALAFYDRLGADRVEDKVYYRLSGDTLAKVAGDPDQPPAP